MIQREISDIIHSRLFQQKAIIIMGPRQVGKTTLIKEITQKINKKTLWLNGDELEIHQIFENLNSTNFKTIIGNCEFLVIDEAQRIPNIGLKLKIIIDNFPKVQLLVTGSSALELSSTINEPLTGRKWEYQLFPLSFAEMVNHHGLVNENKMLPQRLIFGYYPEVVNRIGDEIETLKQLSSSYLYKDILSLDQVKNSDLVINLLRALALQMGSQVSYNELSNLLGVDVKTIEKYIDLLEKTFIVFRLGSYSRNLRNELKKSKKIYFYDNGIRNAIINNFNPIELRTDQGALWENFIISERMKFLHYRRKFANMWFWRTKQQQEIDLIEEENDSLKAFEFKYTETRLKPNPTFTKAYPNAEIKLIHKTNLQEFLL
jgi:predicted AAA+ superfamily ATPase